MRSSRSRYLTNSAVSVSMKEKIKNRPVSYDDATVSSTTPMNRSKAFRILGLRSEQDSLEKKLLPLLLPSEIKKAADALLEKYEPKFGGNPIKYKTVLDAQAFLFYQQNKILDKYQQDVDLAYEKFHEYVEASYDKDLQRKLEQVAGRFLTFGTKFIKSLRSLKIDDEFCNKYYKSYDKTIESSEEIITRLSKRPLNDKQKGEIKGYLEKFKVDIIRAHEHLPELLTSDYIAKPEDSLNVLKSKYHEYLDAISELSNQYPNYAKVLNRLHADLETLGTTYIDDIQRQPSEADPEKISQDYATKFNNYVEKAKIEFQKEPSIWQNLHPCLKGLCTVIFVIKWIIYSFETETDRHRMYHPDQFSIQQSWKRWEMDCMPKLDDTSTRPTPPSGKNA